MTEHKRSRYNEEIASLDAIVGNHRGGSPSETADICAFVGEKLGAARSALERDDEEAAWVSMYGAASFCRASRIQPDQAGLALTRIKLLLS
ncbi:MAG TPA: hypothetical protein VFC21_04510 [Bryobacteraceae bacterium]|nr:hypothetical protein [Bryobacteraceae bacterium]